MTMRKYFLLLFVFLVACAPKDTPAPEVSPAVATAPPSARPETPSPTPTLLPAPTPVPLARAQYTITAALDYAAKTVDVQQNILYPNQSGMPLNDLVLAVEPNLWTDGFLLRELSVDGSPANYSLTGQKMTVSLSAPLEADRTILLEMRYTLNLPFAAQADPNESRPRIYGYTARQVNLTNWYPFIVPYIDGEWVLHDPWFYGEHLVYDAADYTVAFSVNDPTVVVAASALAEATGEGSLYQLEAGRAFVISASPEYRLETATVGDVAVSSYFFPFYEKPGKAVLEVTARAVALYEELYGAYPHASISAVMGDFNDGMEYSGFYFLPNAFYNLYDGTAKNYLTFVAAHETAHQWWFETVANDQALEPWLDESLCAYSEYLYYERYHPDLLDWWQPYRMYYYDPAAQMDISVYEGGGFQPYTNAVYFRGVFFLNDLRAQIGDEAFFSFLQDYRNQYNRQIAAGDDFFRILRAHTEVDFAQLTQKYFRTPR